MTVIMQHSTVKDAASTLTEEFKELSDAEVCKPLPSAHGSHKESLDPRAGTSTRDTSLSLMESKGDPLRGSLLGILLAGGTGYSAMTVSHTHPSPEGRGMRYILDHKEIIRGRRVLDVGSGCGGSAIAAAAAGASRVLANDIDPFAEMAIKMNAEINNVVLETDTKNYIGTSCDQFDIILIGDMFYDEEFGNMLFTWLKQLTERDKTVLIGDPGRHGLTGRLQQLTSLARYDMPRDSCDENNGFTETTVFKLNK